MLRDYPTWQVKKKVNNHDKSLGTMDPDTLVSPWHFVILSTSTSVQGSGIK